MAYSRIESPAVILVGTISEHNEDCACPDGAMMLTFEDQPNTLENDCACAERPFTLSGQIETQWIFARTPDVYTADLPQAFRLAFSPYAPAGPSVLNAVAWERWQTFAQPQPLTQPLDHALAAQRLILPAHRQMRVQPAKPETLTAWLHITNACNLDCPYCYVRKSSARMTEEIGTRALACIFDTARQDNFRRVKLKYAGGEATLHFALIRRLHEKAVTLARETGLQLREVVLSNGTCLQEEDAAWFGETGVKLMLSLDGVGEMHNRLRHDRGGRDTFARIETTVDELLLPRGIRPAVTITLTRVNAAGAADAVRWALERDLPVSLNFYRQNLLSVSREELALEEQAIIEGMLKAYAVFEEFLPKQFFLNGMLDRVQMQAHTQTCGVGTSYLVITHEGKLAQCQMHLDRPVSATLDKDLLAQVAAGPIRQISVDDKDGCRDCMLRYRCSGGCPLETFRATGRWDVASPHCNIYQTLLPAALRLEGLRLLKEHGYLSLDFAPASQAKLAGQNLSRGI